MSHFTIVTEELALMERLHAKMMSGELIELEGVSFMPIEQNIENCKKLTLSAQSVEYVSVPVGTGRTSPAPVLDWSKAPEDATHGRVTTAGVDFYKRILGEWVYLNSRNQWERAYGTSEANCEERPKPTPAYLRNKACDEMFGVILKMPEDRRHNRSDIVEALYDAGYRKP